MVHLCSPPWDIGEAVADFDCPVYLDHLVFFLPKIYKLFDLSLPGERYSKYMSCALNLNIICYCRVLLNLED